MNTLSPALTVRHRTCSKCGEDKPWFAFYPASRWPDGSMRRPRPDCIKCVRARSADYYRTHARQIITAHMERWHRDAAYRQAHYARKRKKRERGIGRRLDGGPFAQFLLGHFDSLRGAADVTGVEPRQLAKYLNGTHQPSMQVVDRVLCRVDDGTRIEDLYPELEVGQ